MNKNITNTKNFINDYYKQIKDIPLLNKKEEKQLFLQYKNSDIKAKQKLIEHNLKLVVHIVRKYYYDEFLYEDLIQEGNCALIRAVEKYDINSEFKFSMYAAKAIENRIVRYIQNNSKTIRIPVHLHKYIKMYDSIILNNPGISNKEIINIMNISESILDNIKCAKRDIISLELPLNEDKDITLGSIVTYDELFTEDVAMKNIILEQMFSIMNECLTENEKTVIMYRYCYEDCNCLTQEKIGQMLGLTRQRIDQIEKKAIAKLKEVFVVKEKQIYFDEEELKFKSRTIINNLF